MHRVHLREVARLRAPLAVTTGLLVLLAGPSAAFAHAELDTSTPAEGSVVTTDVTEIVLTYTQGLADGSSITLKDASGATVASATPTSVGVKEMRATFAPLAPGAYTIESVTFSSEDGEGPARALVHFTVAEPTAAPPTTTPVPSNEPSVAPSATPPSTAAPAPSAGTASGGGLDVLFPIAIVGLAVGIGVGFLTRRKPS